MIVRNGGSYKNIHNFCLKTSKLTKAARILYLKNRDKNFMRRLARRPLNASVNLELFKNECKHFLNMWKVRNKIIGQICI